MIIKELSAKKIKDSRGEPTIEVSVNNCKASSPSGKSKGKYETPSFHISLNWNINAINSFQEIKVLNIFSFADLHLVEDLIKIRFKLKNVKQFGANALYALESAILKALAKEKNKELWQIINEKAKRFPIPLGNAVGGGLHSHNKNAPIFQEFLLASQGYSFKENYKIMKSVYSKIKNRLKTKAINDEGAWQTSLSESQILEVLSKFRKIRIGIDIAASSFYGKSKYHYKFKSLTRKEQIDNINQLIKKYNLLYVEDPLEENDFQGFSKIKKKNLVCGDDLTVTHIDRLKKAIKEKSINALIIKPNQNGSLLELHEIFKICKRNRIKTILSHRSGETLDTGLADYAFGFGADYIKCGIATPWRGAKLNRLLEIEKSLK